MPIVQENIPDQDTVTAQAPQNRVSGFQYARSGSYLHEGLEQLSQGLDAVATPFAEAQAASDLAKTTVTRDAQGNVTVSKPTTMPIFGPAGQHYDAAVAAGTLAMGDNQTSDDIANLRAQNEGNPSGFKSAVDAYVQRIQASNPGTLGSSMAQNAARIGNQHYVGMVNEQARTDVENSKAAINDAMTAKFNTLSALAQQGGTGTPEFQQARDEYGALSNSLVANPAFGVSKDVQAANDKATDGMLMGYATVGGVEKTYKASGIVAARQELYDHVNDPSLDLSPKERNTLIEAGDARLRFLTGQNAADVAANSENVRALDETATNPKTMGSLSEPIWQAALEKAKGLGDLTSIGQLNAMHEVWQHDMMTRGMSPNQSLATHGIGPGQQAAAPAEGEAKNQNPGNIIDGPWARSQPGYVGANGRFAVFDSVQSGAAAMAKNLHSYGSQGIETLNQLTAKWAPLGDGKNDPVAYAKTISNATGIDPDAKIDLTDPATVSKIIPAMAGVEQGHPVSGLYAQPTGKSADRLPDVSTTLPPSVNGNSYSAADYKANPFLLSAQVRAIAADRNGRNSAASALLDATEQSLKNGFAPDPKIGAQIIQFASDPDASPEVHEKAQKVAGMAGGMALAGNAINVPPAQAQAYVDHIHQLAATSGDLYQQSVAEQFQKSLATKQEQLKKDPWGSAQANGWIKASPIPLQFDDPSQLGVALHQRSDAASAIAARTGDDTLSALAPDEMPQVRGMLENGSPQQQTAFWQAMSTLPADRRAATLRELGGNDPQTLAKVAAGSMMQTAPDIAQSIMRGQNAIKADKLWAPDEQATTTVGKSGYGADMDKALPPTIFNFMDRSNPAGAYATTTNMIRARYADLAAAAGDKTYSPARLDQSVSDVTGGVLTMNGGSFIAPRRGLDQSNFDGMMQGLGDRDLAGVTTMSGRPITADYVRQNAQLENAGDGKYFIRLGRDPSRPVYAMSQREAPPQGNGQFSRFVLDLSNRPATPLASPAPEFMPGAIP